MLEKGSWTLAVTMIFNPVILLFYQNCSYTPQDQLARNPASVLIQQVAYAEDTNELPQAFVCAPKLASCPVNE